jgi:hypothetical protein
MLTQDGSDSIYAGCVIHNHGTAMEEFVTRSVRMERLYTVHVPAPEEDVDRIMDNVCQNVPLTQGAYDQNAWVSASGTERYRPREGAAAGKESDLRKRPGVVEISFELPYDRAVLERVIETIYQVHSYQEQTIKVQEALVSRTKGLDDKANPYRWWNTTGDWKKNS